VTAKRPSKPWRVTALCDDTDVTYSFTSEAKAYAFVRASLSESSPAYAAKVEQWEGGRWWHFETVTADEIRAGQTTDTTEK